MPVFAFVHVTTEQNIAEDVANQHMAYPVQASMNLAPFGSFNIGFGIATTLPKPFSGALALMVHEW